TIKSLPQLLATHTSLSGLNVTIPYKLEVIPFLNAIDEAAQEIGAVNCISIEQQSGEKVLKGYNTDAYGFEESIKPLLNTQHKKALVFGDGGAAKAVKYVLNKLNIPFLVVSRGSAVQNISYFDVTEELLKEYTILINTTPLGMSPNTESYPDIPYAALSDKHLAYDLVYNPEQTLFLKKAQSLGAKVKNGLEMLHLQAERSWHIWNS
ncbi:MAG: shikimate dehydrogenase, partial [Sphingobacteriales bacterium]